MDPGELTPSQHLGLARLASMQYDRVKRLPLPEGRENGPPLRRNWNGGSTVSGRRDERNSLLDEDGGMSAAGRRDRSDNLLDAEFHRGGDGVGAGPEQPCLLYTSPSPRD